MGRILKKLSPSLDSPIGHNTRDNYCLYYGMGKTAYYYRMKHHKIMPIFVPVYRKGEICRYQRILVDTFDLLYWLDIHGEIDLEKVSKTNPVLARSRRKQEGPTKDVLKMQKMRDDRIKKHEDKKKMAKNDIESSI